MCESGSRKRKIRQNSTVEMSKTVKGFFKKDDLDLDDSLSTSDWGLIIDDNYVSITLAKKVLLISQIAETQKKRPSC
jgi:hypothetical protein